MHRIRGPVLFLATLASIATSSLTEAPPPTITTRVVLHNAGSRAFTVESQSPTYAVDCSLVAQNRVLLASLSWNAPESITIEPGANRALTTTLLDGSCSLARLSIPGVGTRIVAAHEADFPTRDFPLSYASPGEVQGAVLALVPETPNQILRPTSSGLVFEETAPLEECGEADRSAPSGWSIGSQGPAVVVERIDLGHGCSDLLLETPDGVERLELCLSGPELEVDVGDAVSVTSDPTSLSLEPFLHIAHDANRLPDGLVVDTASGTGPVCIDTTSEACKQVVFESMPLSTNSPEPIAELFLGETTEVLLESGWADVWMQGFTRSLNTGCQGELEIVVQPKRSPSPR